MYLSTKLHSSFFRGINPQKYGCTYENCTLLTSMVPNLQVTYLSLLKRSEKNIFNSKYKCIGKYILIRKLQIQSMIDSDHFTHFNNFIVLL